MHVLSMGFCKVQNLGNAGENAVSSSNAFNVAFQG